MSRTAGTVRHSPRATLREGRAPIPSGPATGWNSAPMATAVRHRTCDDRALRDRPSDVLHSIQASYSFLSSDDMTNRSAQCPQVRRGVRVALFGMLLLGHQCLFGC